MGLQLLKPTEAKVAAEVREEEDLRRATTIKDITRQLLDQKAEAERAFEQTLTSQQARWETEETEKRAIILALQREVESLEEQKERALIPIVEREVKLHNDEEEFSLRCVALEEKEDSIEEERRLLMQKLDEVSDREVTAIKLQSSLGIKKKGIEAQQKQTAAGAKLLSNQIEQFTRFRFLKGNELSEREAVIEGKSLALDERQKYQDEREKKQNDRDAQLTDKYETLLRTQKEIHARNSTNTGK